LRNGGVSERSTIEYRIIDTEGFQEGIQEGKPFGVSRGINDYLQIMKNVSFTFFNALFDYLINHSLTGKKKLINENRNLKSKNVKVPCPRV